jgi:hypothetical protein
MASPLEGLKKVVDILNQEPFSLGLTLVTLDSKDGPGLIGVLNKGRWGNVLAYIDQSTPSLRHFPRNSLPFRCSNCCEIITACSGFRQVPWFPSSQPAAPPAPFRFRRLKNLDLRFTALNCALSTIFHFRSLPCGFCRAAREASVFGPFIF